MTKGPQGCTRLGAKCTATSRFNLPSCQCNDVTVKVFQVFLYSKCHKVALMLSRKTAAMCCVLLTGIELV
jgi:hypothetical protein